MGRPTKIITKKFLTDKEVSNLEGTWIDESFIKLPVVTTNTDVYYEDEQGTQHLLLKFRKGCISENLNPQLKMVEIFICKI